MIVLGMHRSGTSALTKVLGFLGCDLPKSLMAAGEGNEAGHWESRAIWEINNRILASAGSFWDDWQEFNPNWINSPKAEQFRDDATSILTNEFGSSWLFALKDPRICRILPFWIETFGQGGIRPIVVSIIRNPREVADSLARRNGFDTSFGYLLWLRHVLDAEFASRRVTRFYTNYDRLMTHTSGFAEASQAALDIAWPRLSARAAKDIASFLSDQHRHHREPAEAVLGDPSLHGWFRDTFAILEKWTKEGESSEDFAELDRIRIEFNAAAPAFALAVEAGNAAIKKARDHEETLAEMRGGLESATQELSKEKKRAQRLEQDLILARKTNSESSEKLVRLSGEHSKEVEASAAARSAFSQAQAELEKVSAALGRQRRHAVALEQRIVTVRAEAESELAQAESRRDEAARAAEAARKALEELRAELEKALGSLSEKAARASGLEEALSAAREEHERLREELVSVRRQQGEEARAAEAKDRRMAEQVSLLGQELSETKSALSEAAELGRELEHELAAAREAASGRIADIEKQLGRVRIQLDQEARARAVGQRTLTEVWARLVDPSAAVALIEKSRFFDRSWYLAKYQDVASSRVDPVGHYLCYGAQDLRDPGPNFSTKWYLEQNGDVRRLGINPLVHFILLGEQEGRAAVPPKSPTRWWKKLAWAESPNSNGAPLRDAMLAVLARMSRNPAPPVLIVPIYNSVAELQDCLQALARHTPVGCRVLLIDDASPDPGVADTLSEYRGRKPFEIYVNEANLGFTRTVNRGIELAGQSDVIFLTSNTKVTPGWIRNLRLAAYSGDKVGTATPFSNNAGAFSAPDIGQNNPVPSWMSLDEYSRAVTQAGLRLYPSTPTGNGFCMYVRRDCLDEAGLLDAEAFPRGYGEENDFCMRALRLGWSHVLDDATYIYHARSVSFGKEKTDLFKEGRTVVDARYPEYTRLVREFTDGVPLKAARERVCEVASAMTLDVAPVQPRVLFVLATRTGGTPQTNQDLMTALDRRIEPFVLRCDSSTIQLLHFNGGEYVEVERHKLVVGLKAFPHRSAEYDAVVAAWLVQYGIELVHIRHVAWHGLGLVDVAKTLGLPVVFSIHDFYMVCPTVKLLDHANVYCGGRCTISRGECRHELWKHRDFPPLKHAGIYAWRDQMASVLRRCDALVTTNQGARDTLLANYPDLATLPFEVIPHGRDFTQFWTDAAEVKAGEKIRLLVPGNLSPAKGAAVVAELGRRATELSIEVHVLGAADKDVHLPPEVIQHGRYHRWEFADKVRAIQPHIGGVFSIWPETYSHTLTELWASGVPVIGFDYGAVGERIRKSGAGWIAQAPTAAGVVETIMRLRADPGEHAQRVAAAVAWQERQTPHGTTRWMGDRYFDLYRSLIESPTGATVGERRSTVAIISKGAKLAGGEVKAAPGSTYVRLATKVADSFRRPVRYEFVKAREDIFRLAGEYDAILVQRDALGEAGAAELVRGVSESGAALLLDLDDDLIEIGRTSLPGGEYEGVDKTVEYLIRNAHLVFVSTEQLRDRFIGLNRNVAVEPNALAERLWLAPLPSRSLVDVARGDDAIRAVYMGSFTHASDLALLKDPVANVRKNVPNFRLFTVGVTNSEEAWHERIPIPAGRRNYTEFAPWVRSVLATMDFGLAPLVDTKFNRAKSDLKFLEYTAGKLACLASNVKPFNESIDQEDTGILVDNTPESWEKWLLFACNNREALAGIAERAHLRLLNGHLMRHRQVGFDLAIRRSIAGASRGSQAGRRNNQPDDLTSAPASPHGRAGPRTGPT